MDERYYQRRIVNTRPIKPDELNVLSMGYERTVPGKTVGPCIREKFILLYILDGKGYFGDDPIERGNGVLICPNQKHAYRSDDNDPLVYCWATFFGMGCEELLASFGLEPKNHIFKYTWRDRLELIMQAICAYQPSVSASAEYMNACFNLICSLHREGCNGVHESSSEDGQKRYVDIAVRYIQNNYYHSSLKVSDVAKFIGIDRHYLTDLFTKYMDMSPKRYIVRTRLDHARFLLAGGNLSVAEVALSVGYGDQLYFSRLFKRYMGMPPSKYTEKSQKIAGHLDSSLQNSSS